MAIAGPEKILSRTACPAFVTSNTGLILGLNGSAEALLKAPHDRRGAIEHAIIWDGWKLAMR
jgi:hypothetical protein